MAKQLACDDLDFVYHACAGAIVHYNGSAWSLIPNSPTTATLGGE